MLVEHLPPDAALARAVRGTHWSEADYLLALAVDHLAWSRYEFAKANGANPTEPEPVRRPGDTATGERAAQVRAAHDEVLAQLRG